MSVFIAISVVVRRISNDSRAGVRTSTMIALLKTAIATPKLRKRCSVPTPQKKRKAAYSRDQ